MIDSLEEVAKKEFLSSEKEVTTFFYKEKQYWIKKARATIPNKIQSFFYIFLPFELLIPSLYKDKKQALEFETSKIDKLATLGVNVPKVLLKCDDFFLLEDSGKSVNSFLRDKNISEKSFYYFVDKLLEELSKIHKSKQFHGGSQIRNFTYKNSKVFVIDFEESFSSNVDIKALQYRDFLLFILSFIKIKEPKFETNYAYILTKYEELSLNKDIIKRFKKLSKRLRFFIWLSELPLIKKRLGSDVINFFKLFKIINLLEK